MSPKPRIPAARDDTQLGDVVLSAMGEGVLLFDPAGGLIYANDAAQALLEHIEIPADGPPPHRLRTALIGGDSMAYRDSDTRHIELRDRVLETAAYPARPSGSVVVVVRDVTNVRDGERLRRDFVANASHELKTPVASILALAETLRSAARDPAATGRLLTRLEQEAGRLAALVRDLLALSRLEGAALPNEPLEFRVLVEAECARARPQAEAAGLRMVVHIDEESLMLTGSESDLTRMVHNLLDNAVRYTPKGGVVTVSLRRRRLQAVLAVADTGVGIPRQDLSRVFERFYRVDAARSRQTGGTGLGLSIVRNVAQAHGGDVDVSSRVGGGSTFTVLLPIGLRISDQTPAVRRGNGSPDRGR